MLRTKEIQGYEPFGSLLPGRNYSSGSYRFGFQGQEKDDEMHGATGTSIAFEYRIHDPRIGRFLSIDPLSGKYPMYSPYHFSSNQPIHARELEGLESSWDLNSRDPNYQMMNSEQREQFRNSSQKPAMDGIMLGASWGPLAAGVRAAWATGGWRAALRLVTKEAVEEGATEVVERVTGIPMVASPMDVLQAARKGGKFIGELSKLSGHERKRAAEYLEAGSSLERIDRGPGGTADFLIDGKVVEFKSVQGDVLNMNTAVTRLQDATAKEGVQILDLDIRTPGGTASDATSIYVRFAGTKEGKAFLGGGGQVRVASSEGLSTFGGGQ